jgi:hypothetical protein
MQTLTQHRIIEGAWLILTLDMQTGRYTTARELALHLCLLEGSNVMSHFNMYQLFASCYAGLFGKHQTPTMCQL